MKLQGITSKGFLLYTGQYQGSGRFIAIPSSKKLIQVSSTFIIEQHMVLYSQVKIKQFHITFKIWKKKTNKPWDLPTLSFCDTFNLNYLQQQNQKEHTK